MQTSWRTMLSLHSYSSPWTDPHLPHTVSLLPPVRGLLTYAASNWHLWVASYTLDIHKPYKIKTCQYGSICHKMDTFASIWILVCVIIFASIWIIVNISSYNSNSSISKYKCLRTICLMKSIHNIKCMKYLHYSY